MSFQTVAELRAWALAHRWGAARRADLQQRIDRCTLLPPDDHTATAWAEIAVARRREGRPIESGDCWIAACAVRHGIPLLTHNRGHFAGIAGLSVVSRR